MQCIEDEGDACFASTATRDFYGPTLCTLGIRGPHPAVQWFRALGGMVGTLGMVANWESEVVLFSGEKTLSLKKKKYTRDNRRLEVTDWGLGPGSYRKQQRSTSVLST